MIILTFYEIVNIDDATLYLILIKRTAASDEPFGRELLVEKLRVERVSRIEFQRVDSLPAFVAASAG